MSSSIDWKDFQRRLLAGDQSVLAELPGLLRTLLHRVGVGEADEESLHNALHEVIASLTRARIEGRLAAVRNLKAYCVKVSVRALWWSTRTPAVPPVPAHEARYVESPGAEPLDALLQAELTQGVRRILELLPPRQALVLELSAGGLKVPEITRHLQELGQSVTRSSVESLLKRGRESFRALARKLLTSGE